MSFKKPFRAVPVKPGPRYRQLQADQDSVPGVLIVAAIAGALLGIGSLAFTAEGRAGLGRAILFVTVATGPTRARAPQAGDSWNGCNDARAAGTAPIYRGEPGYFGTMDGDDDGIACEPYYGN